MSDGTFEQNHKGTDSPTALASSEGPGGTPAGNSLEKGINDAFDTIQQKTSSLTSSMTGNSASTGITSSTTQEAGNSANPSEFADQVAERTAMGMDSSGSEVVEGEVGDERLV